MAKLSDIRIVDVTCSFEPVPFRTPLKFGGRITETSTLINVEVSVERSDGRYSDGFGSMPLGNIWAWPSESVSVEQAESAMQAFAERVAELVGSFPDYGHPLDIMYQVSAEYHHLGRMIADGADLDEPIPELAQLVAASPTDAALHDAFGRVNGINGILL